MAPFADRFWVVVGGVEKCGILVRCGRELSSPEAESRLSTGAVVRELDLVGDRLHYARVRGAGPEEGWVSLRLKDRALLERVPAEGLESPHMPRKLRLLCLHGTAGSPGVLKRQLLVLSRELAEDVELVFHGGHIRCEPDDPIIGGQVRLVQPFFPNEVLTQYAIPRGLAGSGGDPADRGTWRSYEGLDDAIARIQEAMRREAPIDAVFGFSQGSNLLTILSAQAASGRGADFRCAIHDGTSLPGWIADRLGAVASGIVAS